MLVVGTNFCKESSLYSLPSGLNVEYKVAVYIRSRGKFIEYMIVL